MSRAWIFALWLLSAAAHAAATIYVSNAATNGYIVGTDGGACTTAGAPCLTYAGAQTAATAGDTIVCNGTFTMTNGITLSKALTTNPSIANGCTLAMTNANANVIQFSASQTFGAVTIDGTNATSANIKPSAAGLTLNLNGTKITNCPTHCLDNSLGRVTSATWIGATMTSTGAGATSCFKNTNSGTATYLISGGTYSAASLGNLAACMTWNPSATGTSITVTGATISVTAQAAATNTKCYYAPGASSQDVFANSCASGGATTTPEAFVVPGHATVAVTHADFHANTATSGISSTTLTDGHGIQIGDETDVSSAAISSPIIYGNTITGFNHAIYCGYATTGCRMLRNRPSDSVIGVIQEGGSGALAEGNIVSLGALTGGGLRSRHGTNNVFANNTIVIDAGVNTGAKWFEVDDSDTGAQFTNNAFINASAALPANAGLVSSGLSATFTTNSYYSAAYATGAFNNGTTAYSSDAAWKAAVDTSAVISSPLLVGGRTPSSDADFCLKDASPLIGAGTWIGAYILDYRGRGYDNPPAIGAMALCRARPASGARRATR